MISPEGAWARLAAGLAPLASERAQRRAAAGRILAAPVLARADVPALDVSAMDGYAVGGELTPGEERPVAGVAAAGDPPGLTLPPGAAVRIMTGAPLPAGADRVVPVEDTDGGRARVTLRARPGPGQHVRRRAEVVRVGDQLLPAGMPLTPGALALLASQGIDEVSVHRSPRVATLATGDEVVPPDASPDPGQLRDSHTDFLLAAGAGLGLAFTPLGIARDRADELRGAILRGLDSDVLLVSGGVSKGEFDVVEGVLADLGCETLFDAVAIQPGKPLVAARHSAGLIIGLPGNPASVMVGFWLFVRPLLRRLLGAEDGYWHGALEAALAAPLPGARGRARFLPAEIAAAGARLHARPIPPVGSHDLAAYARGTALVRVPAGAPPRPAGDPCEILPIASPGGLASR